MPVISSGPVVYLYIGTSSHNSGQSAHDSVQYRAPLYERNAWITGHLLDASLAEGPGQAEGFEE